MISQLLTKIVGSRNQRLIKAMGKHVVKINALEDEVKAYSDESLAAKTAEFKKRLAGGETLEDLLCEAFAVVREVGRRQLGLRHFDVQLIGGIVLFNGKIAEMRTGEGKTLAATLPAYLMALAGQGVHLVTVNDYLAQRDADWMRPIYEFLGMTVGINLPGMDPALKREAYQADITYGTNNEFGFDYLRDNMAISIEQKCQRELHYAIIDEVDSILIDEARTPLIISGAAEQGSDLYLKINALVPKLTKQEQEDGPGDFSLDEKAKQAYLTEAGHEKVETLLFEAGLVNVGNSLYDSNHIALMHHVQAALRAHHIYKKDFDYIVKDNQVIIVDEHTGRLMSGRRWSDGLHQAVEAKEGVKIESENQTLASITFQNYFRMYNRLAGMTGTADTEAYEFQQIYGLEVVVIPTNRETIRVDHPDHIYLSQKDKYQAIEDEIARRHEAGQPVLVGTASIDASEHLSKLLKKRKIKHQVLNAKHHDKEAKIIAQAGRPGAVTLATNMAGRGTDVVLGGNLDAELAELGDSLTEAKRKALTEAWRARHKQVIEAGGLHVLGTERNESRRIDNQLRGRSGRQGDPGSSRFYLSLEDALMRIFAADRLTGLMQRLGMQEGEVLESPMVTKVIEGAQRKVEGHNFDLRKQLLQYDDVANEQRRLIYNQRDFLLEAETVSDMVERMLVDVVAALVNRFVPPESFEEQWDISGLQQVLAGDFGIEIDLKAWLDQDAAVDSVLITEKITNLVEQAYQAKRDELGEDILASLEKSVLLQLLDVHWKEHLANLDILRQGIHLRGYAQKDPAQEFKREGFEMFQEMLASLRHMAIAVLLGLKLQEPEQEETSNVSEASKTSRTSRTSKTLPHQDAELGRNSPCPCGSGRKYKHCHGRLEN